jgi:hypothetical protein
VYNRNGGSHEAGGLVSRVCTGGARDQNKRMGDGGVAVPSRALTGLLEEEDQQHDLAGWIPRDLTDREL